MPNPSELERIMQETDETPMSLLRAFEARFRSVKYRVGERITIWIAWHLPRRVVLWAMIRVAAFATTGRWGNESPATLTYGEMHDRWEYR